jgi:hypothetical protein
LSADLCGSGWPSHVAVYGLLKGFQMYGFLLKVMLVSIFAFVAFGDGVFGVESGLLRSLSDVFSGLIWINFASMSYGTPVRS